MQTDHGLGSDMNESSVKADDSDQKVTDLSDIFLHRNIFQKTFHIFNRYVLSVLDFKPRFKEAIDGLWKITARKGLQGAEAQVARPAGAAIHDEYKAIFSIKESA